MKASNPTSAKFGSERAFIVEAIASSYGKHPIVSAIFAVIIFATGLLFSGLSTDPINPQIMDLSAGMTAVLVFLAANFSKRTGKLVNVATWLLAGTLSSMAPNLAILAINGRFDEYMLAQLPIGIVAYSTNIVGVALIWSGFRLGLQKTRVVRENLLALQRSRETLEQQLELMRGAILDEVKTELGRATSVVNTADSTNREELAERILDAIDNVIRPLSHRLAGFGVNVSQFVIPNARAIKPTKSGVAWSRLAGPEIFLLLFLIFIAPASFLVGGNSSGLTALALAVALAATLAVLERFAKEVVLVRGLGLLLNGLIAGLFGLAYAIMVNDESKVGVAVGYVTVTFAVSSLLALVSKRVDTLINLAYVSAEQSALVIRLGQETWVTKTRLAKAIHGAVQAKFLAVALKLRAGNLSASEEIREATTAIEQSLLPDEQSLLDQIQAHRNAWAGAIKVEFNANAETLALADSDHYLRSCIAEVIGEAIANAAKHSKAEKVRVDLHATNEKVQVTVTSAGSLSQIESSRGYGSTILDQITNSWSLTEAHGKVILEANFQLGKHS